MNLLGFGKREGLPDGDAAQPLGICRGIQVVAVAAGGTICQDLPAEQPQASLHQYGYLKAGEDRWQLLAHEVDLSPACFCRILWFRELGLQKAPSIPHRGKFGRF